LLGTFFRLLVWLRFYCFTLESELFLPPNGILDLMVFTIDFGYFNDVLCKRISHSTAEINSEKPILDIGVFIRALKPKMGLQWISVSRVSM